MFTTSHSGFCGSTQSCGPAVCHPGSWCEPTVCAVGAAVQPSGPAQTCQNLRQRGVVDARVREAATEVRGSKKTPIYVIDDFLAATECAELIRESAKDLRPSPLARQSEEADFRTSKTAFFGGRPLEKDVERRITELLGIPDEAGESAQIQHYDRGNQFKPHYDYFHPGLDDAALEQGQRTWTTTIYLSDVDKGGHTNFVSLGESVEPKTGRAVIWSNLKPDGAVDDQTLHQGSPVEAGTKDIVTRWFRDKCR
jgi:prolyl 4-hydroxylase